MFNLAERNLRLFFRDKSTVFFSLLAVIIIIGLYVLFLGDTIAQDMTEINDARFLMDSWIMGGLLAVTSVTTTLGAFGTMVEDRAKGNAKDFYASPLKRYQIAGGYVISSFMVGIIMCVITFVLAEIYIVANGGELLPLLGILKVFGLILLSVLSSSAMVFFLVSFFSSTNAFATASTVIGTLIGFLTGIYIPIGNLPDAVQLVVKIFPVTHSGVLFRQVFMSEPLETAFGDLPANIGSSFREELGIILKFGDQTFQAGGHILVLVGVTVIFFGLAVWNISRKKS
ncbi:ABC transporter [Pradoshia eiseniae]|uniref:ABC transporter n=1 Tax=Pradoshia eiseniae TaxID=2064768 RepID=A0A2S7MX04_9BACI|nr:ABC transporter permease [Pradoshia eiseniae]PQD94280.1 ABC transporter [Pradoshia eiseniae]